MKRPFSLVLFLEIFAWPGCWQGGAQSSHLFLIDQPNIIAFFPITQADVDSSEDAGEAPSDFDYHVSMAEKRLRRAGIAIRVVNARSFQIRTGKKTVTFQPKKSEIGC
jgi:hypothetical protein